MGTVCSGSEIRITRHRRNSIFIFSDPIQFASLYTVSERILNDSETSQIRLCKRNSSQVMYILKTVKNCPISLEARILKSLSHPNVIKFIQCFSFTSQSLIILEYLPHGDLGQYLKKGKVSEKAAIEIMKQVLQAIEYIHSTGIYHRDLKPENILLESVGKKGFKCKLADFDSAGYIRSKDKEPYGTLPYMAPEMFIQKYDEKVDIWSCGMLMYRLLTGHLLFFGRDPEEIELRIRSAVISFDCSLSQISKNLLSQLLNRNPKERISAQQALGHPWFTNTSPNELSENNNQLTKAI